MYDTVTIVHTATVHCPHCPFRATIGAPTHDEATASAHAIWQYHKSTQHPAETAESDPQ